MRDLLEANPIFSSSFSEKDGRIRIEHCPGTPIKVPMTDASRALVESRAEAMRVEALGVTKAPLWRAEIFCLEDGTTSLLFCIHHGLFDGWSLNLFNEELAARFEKISAGQPYRGFPTHVVRLLFVGPRFT